MATWLGFRAGQDNAPGYVEGGIVDLGVNWVQEPWYDVTQHHTLDGELNGTANLVSGPAAERPVDDTFTPLAGGAAIDAATEPPADVAAAVAAHPVLWQLDPDGVPVPRAIRGAGPDLGAVER